MIPNKSRLRPRQALALHGTQHYTALKSSHVSSKGDWYKSIQLHHEHYLALAGAQGILMSIRVIEK